MPRVVLAILCLLLGAPALALTGNAPPATGWAARSIVMIVDARGDLCTGTALTHDLVLTAAHCVARATEYQVKAFQTERRLVCVASCYIRSLISRTTSPAAPPPT